MLKKLQNKFKTVSTF